MFFANWLASPKAFALAMQFGACLQRRPVVWCIVGSRFLCVAACIWRQKRLDQIIGVLVIRQGGDAELIFVGLRQKTQAAI